MFEPVEIDDILISVIAGALVVLFGALYALAFALGRLNDSQTLTRVAYGFFVLLAVAALILADALHLTGWWQLITVTILAGYLLAPHGIWKLCAGTHPQRLVAGAMQATGNITGETHE